MAKSKHPFGELPVGFGDGENDLLMELVFPPQQPYLPLGSGRGGLRWNKVVGGWENYRRTPGHTLHAHDVCRISPPQGFS